MENYHNMHADVKVRCENIIVSIPVTSKHKPEINPSLKVKWQKITDIIARCMNVPAALIMEIHEKEISVCITSRTSDNPYRAGSSEELQCGLYCETVLGKDAPLYVADAMDSAYWRDNPDIRFGLRSYLGFPLKWPDGEFFGTICVLDTIENPYMQSYAELLFLLRDLIESDLDSLQNQAGRGEELYFVLTDRIGMLNRERERLMKLNAEKKRTIEKIFSSVKSGLEILSMHADVYKGDSGSGLPGMPHDISAYIDSFSGILDSISSTMDTPSIPMSSCVRVMLEKIKEEYPSVCSNISFGVDIPDYLTLETDLALPCCMIISGAVINSLHNAFSDKMCGEIYIMMRENRPGECMLHISDNGTAIPVDKRVSSPGVEAVTRLVKKINGTVHIVCDKNTHYYIDFRKDSAGNIPIV